MSNLWSILYSNLLESSWYFRRCSRNPRKGFTVGFNWWSRWGCPVVIRIANHLAIATYVYCFYFILVSVCFLFIALYSVCNFKSFGITISLDAFLWFKHRYLQGYFPMLKAGTKSQCKMLVQIESDVWLKKKCATWINLVLYASLWRNSEVTKTPCDDIKPRANLSFWRVVPDNISTCGFNWLQACIKDSVAVIKNFGCRV